MSRLYLFLIFFLLQAFSLKAFTPDENPDPDIQLVEWLWVHQLNSPFITDTNYVSIGTTGFHRYDPFFRVHPFFATKGNIGHPVFSLIFQPVTNAGFQLYPASLYQGYLLDHKDFPLYRPKHVFTDLQYFIGDSREQLFVANHNQKLAETLYVGAVYQIVNSPGFYNRSGARNNYVRLHIDFHEPGKRYQAIGSAVFNRINNQESGGLSDPQAFEEDPDQENIFLNEAVSRFKENSFSLNHSYHLKYYSRSSGDTLEELRVSNFGRLNHRFSYRRLVSVFDESVSPFDAFYDADPVFENATYDSTRVNILENYLSWSNFPLLRDDRYFPFNFAVFARHQVIRVNQPDHVSMAGSPDDTYLFYKDHFNQLTSGLRLQTDPGRLLSFSAKASLVTGGYNDGDYDLGGSIKLGTNDQGHVLELRSDMVTTEAPYFLSHFRGNYIRWDNDFEKSIWFNTSAQYSNRWFTMGAGYYNVENMVFMGPEALPVQNTGTVNVVSAFLNTELNLGFFGTTHQLVYQKADDEYFVNFPEWTGRHSAFFEFMLFNRSLAVKTGVDFFFNKSYQPMAYMPVVQQFFAQDQYQGDDTYIIDVFANFRIRRTRIFVKLENMAGLVSEVQPIYMIPFYPIPESSLKVGISWVFFD